MSEDRRLDIVKAEFWQLCLDTRINASSRICKTKHGRSLNENDWNNPYVKKLPSLSLTEIYRMLHIRERYQFSISSLFTQSVIVDQSNTVFPHVSTALVLLNCGLQTAEPPIRNMRNLYFFLLLCIICCCVSGLWRYLLVCKDEKKTWNKTKISRASCYFSSIILGIILLFWEPTLKGIVLKFSSIMYLITLYWVEWQ